MTRLVANRDVLLSLVSDPAFYTACPEFADLQEATLQAHAEFAKIKRCCGAGVERMFPSLDAAMARLQQLKAGGNTAALDKVKQFLSTKRGPTYHEVAIYYRKTSAGPPDRVVF